VRRWNKNPEEVPNALTASLIALSDCVDPRRIVRIGSALGPRTRESQNVRKIFSVNWSCVDCDWLLGQFGGG
jgi:hypothetical protein